MISETFYNFINVKSNAVAKMLKHEICVGSFIIPRYFVDYRANKSSILVVFAEGPGFSDEAVLTSCSLSLSLMSSARSQTPLSDVDWLILKALSGFSFSYDMNYPVYRARVEMN